MAEAYGKLTGRPGVCFVTRGPGVSNASIGLHTARQDSTPLLLFVGQVGRDMTGREAFQEVNFRKMLSEMTKGVEQVESPARLPEAVQRAFALAMSGRRGPVAVILPEDVLAETAEVADVKPFEPVEARPGAEQMQRLEALLEAASRPLMIVGGSAWTPAARDDMTIFAESFGLPVVAGFRCQDRMDNTNPLYVGELGTSVSPQLAARVQQADLILVVGERLGEMTTSGYTLIEPPEPRQTLVHVHPGAEELGRVYRAELAINAGPGSYFAAARSLKPKSTPPWTRWAQDARREYEAGLMARDFPGSLQFDVIMRTVREALRPDAIITNGAGNFTGWCQRHYVYRTYPSQLAPISGAMGYGFPAALAAKVVHPQRQVVCFAGDGDFMMTSAELATAVHYGLDVVVLIFDNRMYGTIRMHQERHYPGRQYATQLTNPDFAAFARTFGAHGETVSRTEEFAPALERALSAGKPALVHILVDEEVITTRSTLSEIRNKALAPTNFRTRLSNIVCPVTSLLLAEAPDRVWPVLGYQKNPENVVSAVSPKADGQYEKKVRSSVIGLIS